MTAPAGDMFKDQGKLKTPRGSIEYPSSQCGLRKEQEAPLLHVIQNCLDHLISHTSRIRKARSKILLAALESILVRGKISKGDAFRPSLLGINSY